MRVFISLLITTILTPLVYGAFFPVSARDEVSSLRTREDQGHNCLQPSPSIDLYYMEEYQKDVPYVIQVTSTHNDAVYLAVEKFEHLLADLTCSDTSDENTSSLIFAFDTTQSMNAARDLWVGHKELLFVTHHATCNSIEQRAVYKASMVTYDFGNLVANVTGREVELGKSSEASSHLHIKGGPIHTELRKRLRRRGNMEGSSSLVRRELQSSQWIMNLNEFGKFDSREEIISFERLKLACVNCALSGKVGVFFDLDMNFEDLLNPFDGDINPFNVARLRIKTLEAIDGEFNIEIDSTAEASISCSFPGGCSKGKYTEQGKKFKPTERRKGSGINIGGLTLDASFSLGLAVGLNVKASVNVTLPITVKSPANKELYKNFFGDGSGKDELTPYLKPVIGKPRIDREDTVAQLCGFITIGPAITFEARINDDAGVSLSARLDLPRLQFCAALARNVNRACDRGPFEEAAKLSVEIGAGLAVSGQAFLKTPLGQVQAPGWNLETKGLYRKWTLGDVCFDLGGDGNGNDKTLPPTPDTSKEGSQPDDSDFGVGPPKNATTGTGSSGNETGLYDCSSVAPSPGGQPCGQVVMLCHDAYHWSCGNGQEGIVPPGTFCACGAFRYPGWSPPAASKPACTQGIVCVTDITFSVCSLAGIEPPQAVAPGTVCRKGELIAA